MRAFVLAGSAMLALFHSACASAPAHSTSGAVHGDVGTRLDRYLARAASFGFSGAVLVADSAGLVLGSGYGMADEARGIRNTSRTLFDMGSIVKQFTAAAILLLESEGRLSRSDSLKRFFPEAPADKANITLHQLMTHTAGVVSDVGRDYDPIGRDSALAIIWRAPLVSPPGQSFDYSNAGFALLGALIERVSGQPYARFMEERVFHPAGMRETGYRVAPGDSARVAHTYTPPVDHGTPAQRLAASGGPWWNLMANGGMLTTVGDLYAYELALRRGHPVSRALQRTQFAEQFRRSPTLAHGYDWWIEPAEDGGVQFNRGGDANMYGLNAEYRRHPADGSVIILLANNRHRGWSTRRYVVPNLRRLFLGLTAIEPPAVRPASRAMLAPLVGRYVVDSTAEFRVDTSHGRVVLSALGQRAVDVTVFNRDTSSLGNRERANARALDLIRALATGDSAASARALGSAARGRRLMNAWREAEGAFGAFRCAEGLGTDRLDRGVLLTTLRLRFADSTKTVRFTWEGAVPAVNSDDAALANNFGFAIDSPVDAGAWSPYWYASGRDSLVTYDLLTNQTLVARVERAADGAVRGLVFDVPRGAVRARRVAADARATALPQWCRAPARRADGGTAGERAALAMTRYAMHGMSGSILVADSGRRVLERGYGLAHRERGVPATPSTVYDVASITKTFTAAAILRLAADGKVDLRAPIARYFDGVPPDKATITVHHLLTHTAGLALDPAHAGIASTDPASVYVARALQAPLVHPAGSAYSYSNLGYGLLAILIERLSGEDFRTFVTRTLVRPAGLAHIRWWSDSLAVWGAEVARGYQFSDREYVLTPEPPFARGAPDSPTWSKWPIGAAGILTTVGDLTDWLGALTQARVLPDSLTRMLFASQTAGVGSQGYGWNVGTHPALGTRAFRGGGRTGFTSMLAYYPQRRASIAFALNQQADANWQTVVWRSLERALAGLPDTLPPATVALAPAALDSLAGRYAVSGGAHVRILVEDGTLVVGAVGQQAADVLVEPRRADSASIVTASRESLALVRAALGGGAGDAMRALVNDPPALAQWLGARAPVAAAGSLALLATVPHPASAGAVQTFVRLGDGDRAPVVRLIWDRGKVAAWGDGIRLPGFGRFRTTSRDAAVAFHARDAGWRTIEFRRNRRGDVIGIVVETPTGARSALLRRVH